MILPSNPFNNPRFPCKTQEKECIEISSNLIQLSKVRKHTGRKASAGMCVCVTLCDIFIWCQPHMHPCSVIAGNGQKTAQTTWLEQSETQKLANVFWSVAYPSRTQPQVAVPPNLKLHSRMAPRCEIPAWQIPIILCIKLKPQIHHAYNHGQLSIFQLGSCRNGGKKRSGVQIGKGKSKEKASSKSAHAGKNRPDLPVNYYRPWK